MFPKYCDSNSTWSPSSNFKSEEFLILKFEEKVFIQSIKIYETYNPGKKK